MKFLLIAVALGCCTYCVRAQEIFQQLTEIKQTPCTPVKDQYMSSTCWSFAAVSMFESDLLRKGIAEEDISEIYISRYSYIHKIKLHLAQKGANYFTPGGQLHDVLWVMRNYGLMPEAAYNGKNNRNTRHDHGLLDTAVKRCIERLVREKKTEPSPADWRDIYALLDKHLGKVPDRFVYKGHTYTAKTYLTRYLQINPADYFELTSYSHHPFYSSYVLEDKYNWSAGEYYNLPFTDLQAVVDNALSTGYSVLWSGEVQDTGFHYAEGYASLRNSTGNLQALRQQSFIDKTTEQDHLMHVVGLYEDEKKERWYKLKNSWGNTNNNGGFLYMNECYFYTKGVNFTVSKNALPQHIRQKMQ